MLHSPVEILNSETGCETWNYFNAKREKKREKVKKAKGEIKVIGEQGMPGRFTLWNENWLLFIWHIKAVGIKFCRNNKRVEKIHANVCNLGVKLLNDAVHCIEIMNVSHLVEYGVRWRVKPSTSHEKTYI